MHRSEIELQKKVLRQKEMGEMTEAKMKVSEHHA